MPGKLISSSISISRETSSDRPLLALSSNHRETCGRKVAMVANRCFSTIYLILSFPLRYFGSKSCSIFTPLLSIPRMIQRLWSRKKDSPSLFPKSHYQYTPERELKAKESSYFFKYQAACCGVHKSDPHWIQPFYQKVITPAELALDLSSIRGHIQGKEHVFFDPTTGLKAMISFEGEEAIIAFGAIGAGSSELSCQKEKSDLDRKLHLISFSNLMGCKPFIYKQAEEFFKKIIQSPQLNNKKVVLTGQCFGASIASYIGLRQSVQTICFNSLALGVGLQWAIGDDKLRKAHHCITHLSVKNDWASDCRWMSPIDYALNLIGVRTPGIFGRRFRIPSAYRSFNETHRYVLGSLMSHQGYERMTQPKDLPAESSIFTTSPTSTLISSL